jgi:hypothetical protein
MAVVVFGVVGNAGENVVLVMLQLQLLAGFGGKFLLLPLLMSMWSRA